MKKKLCECLRCGRNHPSLQAGTPPLTTMAVDELVGQATDLKRMICVGSCHHSSCRNEKRAAQMLLGVVKMVSGRRVTYKSLVR